jgi:hypothetical protein
MMVAFIDEHRPEHGVEPICKVLPIAPSTYYDHVAKRADPAQRSERDKRDAELRPEIARVFDANFVSEAYGPFPSDLVPAARSVLSLGCGSGECDVERVCGAL